MSIVDDLMAKLRFCLCYGADVGVLRTAIEDAIADATTAERERITAVVKRQTRLDLEALEYLDSLRKGTA